MGISWAGGKPGVFQARRVVAPREWETLLADRRFGFVSLQYGDDFRATLAELSPAARSNVFDDPDVDHGRRLDQNFAQVQACDAVLTIDNSTAHIAGALAKPVWTLLPEYCDWRWSTGGATSPWYPSMRLLRQTRRWDWASVMHGAHQQLESYLL